MVRGDEGGRRRWEMGMWGDVLIGVRRPSWRRDVVVSLKWCSGSMWESERS